MFQSITVSQAGVSSCNDNLHSSKLNRRLVLYEIKKIEMPESKNVLETKLYMFADDTQLFIKNEESVEQAFKVSVNYEKASGSKINYEKTKGLFVGRLRGKCSRFTKFSWVTNKIKAMVTI